MRNITDLSFEEFKVEVLKTYWNSVDRQTEKELKENYIRIGLGEKIFEDLKSDDNFQLSKIIYFAEMVRELISLENNLVFGLDTGKEEK